MQAIAGIPHYYRLFGYEMAMWIGEGRLIYARDVLAEPANGDGAFPAPYRIRLPRRRTHGSSRTCTAGRRRRLGPAQSPVPQVTFGPWPVY